MNRNEAIDILRVIAPPRTSKKAFYDFMEARDMAIAALEGKDTNVLAKWIPVSERLPETEEAYTDCMGFEDGDLSKPISPLTCYESDLVLAYGILDECSEGRQIFVATYDEWKHHETGKIETGWKDNVCGDDCKVFAWMPLPEPWEGEQHDSVD